MRATVPRKIASLGVMALVILVACGGSHDDSGLATASPNRTVTLELRDIAFSEARVEANADEIIDFDLRNVGLLDHDFTIERANVDALVIGQQTAEHQGHGSTYAVHAAPGPGKSITLRLHTHAPAEYTFYCSVKGHREAGMTGTLVVR